MTRIGAGRDHSCAVVETAGTDETAVYCWGNTTFDGNDGPVSGDRPSEPVVTVTDVPVADVAVLAVGVVHTCAIVTAGPVYCWGSDQEGRLGNGGTAAGSRATLVDSP